MSSDNLNSEGSICEKPVFQRVRRNELRPPPPDSSISGVRRIRLQPPVIFQGIRRIKLRPHLAELEHLRRGGAEILLPPLHKASDPLQSPLLMEWLHLHLHLHCSSQQGLCLSLLLSESQRNKRGEAASLAAEKGNDAGLSLASPIAQPQIPNPPASSFPSLCVEKKSSGQWRSGDE
ncbi:Os12g0117666 [Oryza sativa Japonica Group]|uniref:Os12g0117666 protein n=1 Tax=Oryza sativa subsp. japonica TaxID=39947 RepID=A0A0P0Y6D1_ORYSJ|nr:Os12g0117666 [Oryza sativa Japonica Group]